MRQRTPHTTSHAGGGELKGGAGSSAACLERQRGPHGPRPGEAAENEPPKGGQGRGGEGTAFQAAGRAGAEVL